MEGTPRYLSRFDVIGISEHVEIFLATVSSTPTEKAIDLISEG